MGWVNKYTQTQACFVLDTWPKYAQAWTHSTAKVRNLQNRIEEKNTASVEYLLNSILSMMDLVRYSSYPLVIFIRS